MPGHFSFEKSIWLVVIMNWCEVCELFTDEGDIRCSCDEEFMRWCDACGEQWNIEVQRECDCRYGNTATLEK